MPPPVPHSPASPQRAPRSPRSPASPDAAALRRWLPAGTISRVQLLYGARPAPAASPPSQAAAPPPANPSPGLPSPSVQAMFLSLQAARRANQPPAERRNPRPASPPHPAPDPPPTELRLTSPPRLIKRNPITLQEAPLQAPPPRPAHQKASCARLSYNSGRLLSRMPPRVSQCSPRKPSAPTPVTPAGSPPKKRPLSPQRATSSPPAKRPLSAGPTPGRPRPPRQATPPPTSPATLPHPADGVKRCGFCPAPSTSPASSQFLNASSIVKPTGACHAASSCSLPHPLPATVSPSATPRRPPSPHPNPPPTQPPASCLPVPHSLLGGVAPQPPASAHSSQTTLQLPRWRRPQQRFERFRIEGVAPGSTVVWHGQLAPAQWLRLQARDADNGSVVHRQVVLLEAWQSTPAQVGDIVHVLHAAWASCPDGLQPVEGGSWGGPAVPCAVLHSGWRVPLPAPCPLIVLLPDHLVNSTALCSGLRCLRRAWLDTRLKPNFDTAPPMVVGSLVHTLFQDVLQTRCWAAAVLEGRIDAAVRAKLDDVYACGHTDASAHQELQQFVPALQQWATQFLSAAEGGPVRRASGGTQRWRVQRVADIEEFIHSPALGLQGRLDATLEVSTPGNPQMEQRVLSEAGLVAIHPTSTLLSGPHSLLRSATAQSVPIAPTPRTVLAPLELKTGRHFENGTPEHRAQVLLYVALLQDRYSGLQEALANEGLLCYASRCPASATEATAAASSSAANTYSVPLGVELAHLLQRRNELVSACRQVVGPPPLPQPAAMCAKCPQLRNCALWQRLEASTPEPTVEGDVLAKLVCHVMPTSVEYVRHWCALLDLEEASGVAPAAFQAKLVDRGEPEAGCLGNMQLVQTQPHLEECLYTFEQSPAPADAPLQPAAEVVLSAAGVPLAHGRVAEVWAAPDRLRVAVVVDKALPPALHPPRWTLDACLDDPRRGVARLRHHLLELLWPETDPRKAALVCGLAPPCFLAPEAAPSVAGLAAQPNPAVPSARLAECLNQLNTDQRRALDHTLQAQDYCCVLGMPGTGKSTTAAVLVGALAALGRTVLLTAHTHSAVDTILRKCIHFGIPFIRLGRKAQVHPDVHPYLLHEGLRPQSVAELEALLAGTPVLACTAMAVHHSVLARRRFDCCIIDEASQILQPVALGPLLLARTFVLIGDHQQLPPLVRSREAQKRGMAESLFQRLCTAHPHSVVQLTQQYRMNGPIMSIANALVYAGGLRCGDAGVEHAKLEIRFDMESMPPWVRRCLDPDQPVVFLNTDGLPNTVQRDAGGGVWNEAEVALAAGVVRAVRSAGLAAERIGVICPFNLQIRHLQKALAAEEPAVEILTIDRAQGRDKECVVVSLVHCNREGHVGDIMRDRRRLNVAFTRAKHKLVVIGSYATYYPVDCWKPLLDLFTANSWVFPVPPDALLGSHHSTASAGVTR